MRRPQVLLGSTLCGIAIFSLACGTRVNATTISDGLYVVGNSLTRDAQIDAAQYHVRSSSVLRQIREDTTIDDESVSGAGWFQDLLDFDGTLWLQPWGKSVDGHSLDNDVEDIVFFAHYADIDTLLLYQPAPPKNELDDWLNTWNAANGPQYRRGYYEAIDAAVAPLLPGVDITWVYGGDLFYDLWDNGIYTLEELYRDDLHATHEVGRIVLRELAQQVWESAVIVPEPSACLLLSIGLAFMIHEARNRRWQ